MNFNIPLVLNKKTVKIAISRCNYQLFDAKDNSIYCVRKGACHASVKGYLNKGGYILMYIQIKETPYSFTSLLRWLIYMRSVGFKVKYIGKKEFKTQEHDTWSHYVEEKESCYVLRLNRDDFENDLHLHAAITAIRYIYYYYHEGFIKIPEIVFKIKKILKDNIDNLQALSLAYYITGCSETGHAFIGQNWNYVSLIPFEEFKRRLKTCCYINDLLSDNDTALKASEVRILWNLGAYKRLAELLKIKYEQ